MENLTKRQEDILDFLREYIMENSYPPSVREICDAVGLKSTSSVHAQLETLEKKGFIRRASSKTRAIEIIDEDFAATSSTETVSLPVVGNIAAGEPILATENISSYFPVAAEYIPNEESFILKVKGDSMIEAGIFDGDMVLIKKQNYADNGDIVVALLEDSATIKRFYKEKGHYRLQPENSSMDPIIVDNVEILGKLYGLYRFY